MVRIISTLFTKHERRESVIKTFRAWLTLPVFLCAVLCFGGRLQVYSLASSASAALQKKSQDADTGAKAHIPATGSAERKAILDGLRGDQKVVFKVHYLKAHGDWAWVDVTPLDDKGKAVAEGGTSLMHKENGAWKASDLSALPEDPDNPMQEPTPKFVKQLQKAFPGLPADIFPGAGRSK